MSAPTKRAAWVREGMTVRVVGQTTRGTVLKVIERRSLPTAKVQWATSVGYHSISTLEEAPTVVAYRATQFGVPVVEGLVCSICAGLRWSPSIVFETTTGAPDDRCGNCSAELRHGLCTVDGEHAVTPEDAICWPCTDALRIRELDLAAFAREAEIDRKIAEARGK